jgi:predicted PurR-regulated permease PerM
MQNDNPASAKSRVAFLLLLAIGITLLFFWVIKGFVLAILMAAVLAGLVYPIYRRLAGLLGDRKAIASGATVLLSLVLVIIPLLLFLGVLIIEAIQISESAGDWVARQVEQSGTLRQKIQEDPDLKRLLPYQDEIIKKVGELAAKAGSLVAEGIAAGAQATAEFLLMLFVMLYAMFNFLIHGRAILDAGLSLTPLSASDKARLIATFASVGRATLKGTVIIGIVQGGLAGLSFWVAGIEGALFWGAVMTVLSVVPGVGTALVWVPAVIFLTLDGQIGAAVGVGLWCAIVVGTADNLLRPMLIGKDTEMPDLLVMLTTLGGLALFGAAGIVVGPIIGALYVTVWQLWDSAVAEDRGGAAAAAETSREAECAQGEG